MYTPWVPSGARACTLPDPAMAGSDRDISFLPGVSVAESHGTFSKEVADCGDGGLGTQRGEGGTETSIEGSGVSVSFWEESGLSRGKRSKSPSECGTSPGM